MAATINATSMSSMYRVACDEQRKQPRALRPGAKPSIHESHRLLIEGAWIFVDSAEQEQDCLRDCFGDRSGPSHARAVATCAAALAKQVPPDAAQATLIVAAMEAGFTFEVLDEGSTAFELEVEAAAAKGLEDLFQAEAAE